MIGCLPENFLTVLFKEPPTIIRFQAASDYRQLKQVLDHHKPSHQKDRENGGHQVEVPVDKVLDGGAEKVNQRSHSEEA